MDNIDKSQVRRRINIPANEISVLLDLVSGAAFSNVLQG